MARPISHERRSTERLCMLDTACVLAYASGIRLAGGGLFADRDVRIARLYPQIRRRAFAMAASYSYLLSKKVI